jgi:two-component system, OmpR family, sensor histidine kinase KdpD
VRQPAERAIDGIEHTSRQLFDVRVALVLKRVWNHLAAERLRPAHCVYSGALVGTVTVIGEFLPAYVRPAHIAMMYLLAVLVSAIRFGLWPALVAAVLSVAALDYLFLPPLYSFEVNTPQDALLLAFLSVGAVSASALAARLREQVIIAEQNEETTAALCGFAGRLAGTVTLDAASAAVIEQVGAMLPCTAAIYLEGDVPPDVPPAATLNLPLRSSGRRVGSLAVTSRDATPITAEQLRVLEALTELAGIAIGRQLLAERLAQLGIEQAADRLRSALLNSIAHDLTAPIASIATALTSLSQDYDAFDDESRRELIADAEGEAERLHQFSANLIHIARLESGALDLQRSSVDVIDLVDSAAMRARHGLEPRRLVIDLPPGLPHPALDFVLIEQAIFHVLENAGKYTPPDTTVTVSATSVPGGVAIKIADEGPGIPAADTERIFTKFYRARTPANASGTGLGLAICRGFVEAHGGSITATNRNGRSGALFTIVLPLTAQSTLMKV